MMKRTALLCALVLALVAGCLAACGEKPVAKGLNESFFADGYEITVLGGYWADPVIDLDGDFGRFLLRVRMKNTGAERREVVPENLFSFYASDGSTCTYADAAFASAKGYLEAGETREGQHAYLVPRGEVGVCRLRGGKGAEVAVPLGAAQVKAHAPLVLAGLNEPVRIDQLQYTATAIRRIGDFPSAQPGKDYYEIFLNVVSVSAGAPSNIEDRHFTAFAADYTRLALGERNLPDSIATNDSAEGSVIFECPEGTVPAVLGLARHISGQDYSGISLVAA